MPSKKQIRRQKIRYKIRNKISGNSDRPRLAVFRSNKYIYAQIIDDQKGHTIVSVSSRKVSADGTKEAISKEVGKALAEKAVAIGVKSVVFDRGGYLYHGRVKALADGAREGGLVF